MRCAALATVLSGLLLSLPAAAGSLTSATLGFTHVKFNLPSASFNASGLAGLGSASGTGLTASWTLQPGAVPGGTSLASVTATTLPVTKQEFVVLGNDAAAFTAAVPATMAVSGSWRLLGYGGLPVVPLTGVLPFEIGTPNTVVLPPAGGIILSAAGTRWTTGTIVLLTSTTPSAASVTAQGSNALVGGQGSVVLVTPLLIHSTAQGSFPVVASLTLNFVPEPSRGALALAGAAFLAAAGACRSRR